MTTWTVQSMLIKPQEHGQQNVVSLVDWFASDTDGVNEACRGGQMEIATTSGPFTTYDLLTEQQVLEWVWQQIGEDSKAAIEAGLAAQILEMQNPPTAQLPLPWV